jgi:hypothetical protein
VLDAKDRTEVGLDSGVPAIRALYRKAKRLRWDPRTDIPWGDVHPERYSDEVRWAARIYWSGRAWGEYGAIAESPALQLRYEADRLPTDLSLFWAMRTQEEARHAEASAMFAEAMGGYLDQPPTTAAPPVVTEQVSAEAGQSATPYLGTRARALDPDLPVEATIAGLVCVAEQTVYDVFLDLIRSITNPAARRIFQLIVRDEVRHCEFGWAWLAHRSPSLDDDTRARCAASMTSMVQDIELGGYRAPWLAGSDSEAIARERLVFTEGLGGSAAEQEGPALVASIRGLRTRAAEVLGVVLPAFTHPQLGTI